MIDSSNHSRPKAFVTGATGFIGRYLVRALAQMGWTVYILVHDRSFEVFDGQTSVNLVNGRLEDSESLEALISQVDIVYHLAAHIPANQRDSKYANSCIDVNALGTLRLAEKILQNPARRFVYFSTANLFQLGPNVVTESAPLYPSEYATYYLGSKLLGELYVEHLRHTRELNSVVLRLSSVYGFGMPSKSVVANFMNLAIDNKPLQVWDGGRACWDFIYVEDVVQVAIQAGQKGEPGVYNLGSGRSRSTLDLAHAVASVFKDQSIKIEVMPSTTERPFVLPTLSIQKAQASWHYSPTQLEEGLTLYRAALISEKQA
jgi:UDP-glucose 4-epimerase